MHSTLLGRGNGGWSDTSERGVTLPSRSSRDSSSCRLSKWVMMPSMVSCPAWAPKRATAPLMSTTPPSLSKPGRPPLNNTSFTGTPPLIFNR